MHICSIITGRKWKLFGLQRVRIDMGCLVNIDMRESLLRTGPGNLVEKSRDE